MLKIKKTSKLQNSKEKQLVKKTNIVYKHAYSFVKYTPNRSNQHRYQSRQNKPQRHFIYLPLKATIIAKKPYLIKKNLAKAYKLKQFFNAKNKILDFKFDSIAKKSLKRRLKKRINSNLLLKHRCLLFISKLSYINRVKNELRKKKRIHLYKTRTASFMNNILKKSPIKFLNHKFRIVKRDEKLIKKNLFMKINVKRRKRIKPHILVLRTSETNCHMALTDSKGNAKFVTSCGQLGFKGAKRSSKYAIEKLTTHVIKKLKRYNLLNIVAKIKGYSKKHKTIFKLFVSAKIRFKGITEISVAHNGCRLKKVRRK